MRDLLRKWLILGAAFFVLFPPPVPTHPDAGESKSLSTVRLEDSCSAGNGIGNYNGPAPYLRGSHSWGSLFTSWTNSRGVVTSCQNHVCSGGNIDDLFSP